jgi:hypothetical protein
MYVKEHTPETSAGNIRAKRRLDNRLGPPKKRRGNPPRAAVPEGLAQG